MTLWLVLIAMVLAALALPLLVLRRRPPEEDRRGRDLAIYRHQLSELEAERAQGLIAESEADAARVEIERRMLRADAEGDAAATRRALPRVAVIAGIALAIAAALPVYLALGKPGLEGAPAASQRSGAPVEAQNESEGDEAGEGQDTAALIDRLARQMEAEPERLEGWRLLGRAALNNDRPQLAAYAFSRAAELAPDRAEIHAALGESLVAVTDGEVTPAAALAFERALVRDEAHAAARYYIGLGQVQAGEREAAVETWRALLADAPADAPWRQTVARQVARLEAQLGDRGGESAAPPLTQERLAEAEDMSPEERRAMIVSMVNRLAERLENNPNDYKGWLRLARARMMLGDESGAKEALTRARETAPEEMKDEIDRQRTLIEN